MIKEYIKSFPFLKWFKWVIRTVNLKRRFPTLTVGEYTEITNCFFGHQNIVFGGSKMVDTIMDDYSYVGGGTHIQYCTIGKYCSIAEGVKIGLGIHPTNLASTHPAFYSPQSKWDIIPDLTQKIVEYKRVVIEDDVWIGTNAMILDGIHVGMHSIIAAGAVVTKDVPDFAIVAGVPARIIKYRQIEKIEK